MPDMPTLTVGVRCDACGQFWSLAPAVSSELKAALQVTGSNSQCDVCGLREGRLIEDETLARGLFFPSSHA